MGLLPGRGQLPPFLIRRLAWWAEGQFRRSKVLPEGGTLQDAFDSFKRTFGKPHPEDREDVEAPEALLYLYGWFWEMAQGRPFGPEGILLPIPCTEIAAWCQLGGVRLHPWELTAIRALDTAFLKVAAEKGV